MPSPPGGGPPTTERVEGVIADMWRGFAESALMVQNERWLQLDDLRGDAGVDAVLTQLGFGTDSLRGTATTLFHPLFVLAVLRC